MVDRAARASLAGGRPGRGRAPTCATRATPAPCCARADAAGADAVVCCGGTRRPLQPQDRARRRPARSSTCRWCRRRHRPARSTPWPAPGYRRLGAASAAGRTTRRSTGGARPRWCSATRRPGCRPDLGPLDGTVAHPHGRPGRVAQRRHGLRGALLRGPAPAPGRSDGRRRPASPAMPRERPDERRRRRPTMPRWTWTRSSAAGGRRRGRRRAPTDELAEVESAVLGKRAPLALAHRELGALDPDERREAGRVAARGPGRGSRPWSPSAAAELGAGRALRPRWPPTGWT